MSNQPVRRSHTRRRARNNIRVVLHGILTAAGPLENGEIVSRLPETWVEDFFGRTAGRVTYNLASYVSAILHDGRKDGLFDRSLTKPYVWWAVPDAVCPTCQQTVNTNPVLTDLSAIEQARALNDGRVQK